jgi:TP901 family phage tail tape measure protein
MNYKLNAAQMSCSAAAKVAACSSGLIILDHDAGESLKTAGEHALDFGKRLLEITGIAGVIGAALAALSGGRAFEEGIKDAASFQDSITKAGIATNATADELAKLGEAAEAAAETTKTSGDASATALAILAKGAGSAEAAIAQLAPTLLLAKAAQIDTAQAAQTLGTAIAEFGLQADDAQKVVDVLSTIATTTKSDLGELSDGLGKIAPDAKAAGESIQQTAALFGALSDNGIRGRKAVGDLQTIFQQFNDPASKLNETLLGLGLSGQSFNQVIAALAGNSDGTRRAVEALGDKGGSALRALISSNPDIQRLNAALLSSSGAAQNAADKYGNTLTGAFNHFKDVFVDLGESLTKPLLEPLAKQFNLAATALQDFTKRADFAKIRDSILDFVTKAIDGFNSFIKGVNFDAVANTISSFAKTASDSFSSVSGAASALGRTVSGIGGAIELVFNAIKLTITTVVSVVDNSIANLFDGLAKLGQLTGKSQEQIDALKKQAADFRKASAEAYEKSGEAVGGLADGLITLNKAITNSSGAAAGAVPVHVEHAAAIKKSGDAARDAADKTKSLAPAVLTAIEPLQLASKSGNAFADMAARAGVSIKQLEGDFRTLGVTSQSDLNFAAETAKNAFKTIEKGADNTAAGLADKQNAFISYAQKALAATASLDEGTQESTRANLETQASELGLLDVLRQIEQQAPKTAQAMARAAQQQQQDADIAREKAAAAEFNTGVQANIAADKTKEAAKKAEEGFTDWGDAADAAALQTQNITADTSNANKAMNDLANACEDAFQRFNSVSQAAGAAFTKIGLDIGKNLEAAFGPDGDTSGFAAAYDAIANASKKIQDQIDQQRLTLQGEIADINALGQAGAKSFQGFGRDADTAAKNLQSMSERIQEGTYDAGLLGQQELQPLQEALDAARGRVQALADATKAAKQQFDDLAQSAQDALDEAAGNDSAIEDRRHQKQLDDLKAAAKAANELNSAEYQKAVDNENKLHDLKIQNIKDEAKQKNASSNPSTSGGNSSGGSSSNGSSSSESSNPVQRMALDIKLDGTALRALSVDPANANQIAQQLLPHIVGQIQQSMRNAGGRI